jgi:hypothetical protein
MRDIGREDKKRKKEEKANDFSYFNKITLSFQSCMWGTKLINITDRKYGKRK